WLSCRPSGSGRGEVDSHHDPPVHDPYGGARMNAPQHPKIQAHHLSRKALVYVRQSTLHQVFAHGESTARQYGLTATAQDFGWPDSLVEDIDEDVGASGGCGTHRPGFRTLV